MNVRIIIPDGDLKREVWDFLVTIGLFHDSPNNFEVHFNEYNSQRRLTTRHRKWKNIVHWNRFMRQKQAVPTEVEKLLRAELHKIVDEAEIK